MENEEKRMISTYEVTQSIHIGRREVVFGIDGKEEYPYLVCYCTYDNPLSAEWVRMRSAQTTIWKPCRYLQTECRSR